MRKALIFLFLAAGRLLFTAGSAVSAQSPPPGIPSDEAFINQVVHTVVDSSFDRYYLDENARPCSFVKYDYDEWIKYDLQETVPIYTLNELAKNSYSDRKSCTWQQDQLLKASCINQQNIDSILSPVGDPRSDTTRLSKKQKKLIRRKWAAWGLLPASERTVFYFSRPVFTDDGQYAILDMDFRCDNRQCGEGSVCLFRRAGAGWILIGRRVRWSSK